VPPLPSIRDPKIAPMLLRDGCRTTANRKSTFAANVAKLPELARKPRVMPDHQQW